jgi:hypothetical protein
VKRWAMAVVRLGPNGEVEVLVPPTPEEVIAGRAAFHRFIVALARVAEERDFNEWQRRQREAASAVPPEG